MKSKKFWLGMLVLSLVFGMMVFGCELLKEEDFSGTINGTWYLLGNANKTGTIITISDGVGILTAIGENDNFKSNSNSLNIGDTVIRNINFKGAWKESENRIYWDCESFIPRGSSLLSLPWYNTFISYDKKESYMFFYTSGNPAGGLGYRFIK